MQEQHIFSGNIFIFHAFDVADEINLEQVKTSGTITSLPLKLPKYFKNYHIPLGIELPHPHITSNCMSTKIHNFGAISLTYKIPFEDTLEDLRANLDAIENKFQEQSVHDVGTIFKKIKPFATKPKFFHTKSSYLIIQVDTNPEKISASQLKEQYGNVIASALRFETNTLSEYQKNEILESAVGYFKGDLIIIDTDAAFVHDSEYEELLDLFEFGNIQQLELQYFDRILDQQLNILYEDKARKVPFRSYLPFYGTLSTGPIDELGKLKVDISVITERLESSIRLVGEPYFFDLYAILQKKLDLENWKEMVEKKLSIVHEIRSVWEHKIDAIRQDMMTVLIIILIFIEVIIGSLNVLIK